MNRSLKLSILMALALGGSQAAAVELGQAHVKSALGQPLLVDIPVKQASPAELQSLSAQLASGDAFAKAGGQRPSVPLQFNVVDDNGHKVIRVTSSSVIDDPFLDLLVEVNSSTGSNVQEFTILLDPPGKMAPAPQADVARHRTATGVAPQGNAATPPPAPASHAAAGLSGTGQLGPVKRGATLSRIAIEVAPSGVDKNQMMLALKAANPDAFYRDNINALKAGVILRVPSRDDALAMSTAAAAAAVRQENSDWRHGTLGSEPIAVATGGAREYASVAPTASSHEDRLALVPPGSDGQAAGGANGKGGDGVKARQALQRSQEALASLQQQTTELKSRLKDLEDINSKNQRLLSLKDDEIADLQKKLAEARKAAGMPPSPAAMKSAPEALSAAGKAASSATPVGQQPAAAMPNSGKAASPVASASTTHAPAVTTPLSGATKPVAHPPHHTPRPALAADEPWFMQTWALAAGGGVAVLLVLGLLARRGKSRGKLAKADEPAPKVSLADHFGTVDLDDLDRLHDSTDIDQEELLDQLAEQPDDIGLHLELVSLYYSRRDVEHFEAAAEAMHAHITDPNQPEWQDVVHMGQDLVPGHPLFAQSAGMPAHDEHAPMHHFDLDSFDAHHAEEPVQAPAGGAKSQPSTVSEYHFDFNLTPHQAEPALRGAAPVKEHEEEPVSTWHFDEPLDEAEPAQGHTANETFAHDTFGELHDDPVDTKLDLARAYLDMGDPDGARAMLEEVLHEGSQMQKDVAKGLMEKIS